MSQEMVQNVVKGTRVRAQWFGARLASLSGMQMKVEARLHDITGTITHVYGDHPTKPTKFELIVQPDDGSAEVAVRPEWIVVLNVGQPSEKCIRVHGTGPIPEEEPLG